MFIYNEFILINFSENKYQNSLNELTHISLNVLKNQNDN
jgi:hypothetical protein